MFGSLGQASLCQTVVTSPVRYKTYQLVNPLSCHVAKQVFSNTCLLVATATFAVFVLAAAFAFAMFVLAATFAFAVFVVMAAATTFATAFAVATAVAAFVVDERLNFLVSGIAHGYCKGVAFIWPTNPTCPAGYAFFNWQVVGTTTYSSCIRTGITGSITTPF